MDDRHASLKDTSDAFCGTVRRASRRKQDLQGKQQLLLAQHRQACEPCNRLSLCPRAHSTTIRNCYYRILYCILYIYMFHSLNIFRSQILPLLCGFQAEQDRNYARKARHKLCNPCTSGIWHNPRCHSQAENISAAHLSGPWWCLQKASGHSGS